MSLIDDIRKDREAGTPGTWQVGSRHSDNGVFTGAGDLVAGTHSSQRNFDRDRQIEQQDANARRIARVPDIEAALLAASELAAHADAAHDELELWFESANDLENIGFEIGDTELVMNALSRALAAYRKATE